MKLISFTLNGQSGYGAVVGERVVDLARHFSEVPDLASLLAESAKLDDARQVVASGNSDYALSELTLAPVIPAPGKVICVGINYVAHAEEAGRKVGQHPVIFRPGAGDEVLEPRMRIAFLVAMGTFFVLYTVLLILRYRVASVEDRVRDLDERLA